MMDSSRAWLTIVANNNKEGEHNVRMAVADTHHEAFMYSCKCHKEEDKEW